MNKSKNHEWDLEVSSEIKLIDLKLREVIEYRDLIWLFIKRDFNTVYKQTILGPLWFIINPLITTFLYMFVFGNLAHINTNGIPNFLFYFSGTMLWTYFSTCFTDSTNIFVLNNAIFSKVYFPRLTVPISRVISNLITAGIQFCTLLLIYVYYVINGQMKIPNIIIMGFPIIFIWLAAIGMGLGMIVSALTTKYKDLRQLVTFGINLAMYVTPVVYPLSQAPEKYKWFFIINPVSAPIELFRVWFYGSGNISLSMIFISVCLTLFYFFFGLIIFNRSERTFVDVI
ncbi:MAG: ABC transporter permease [Fusobacteriaceae bacterium]|nr:ABC transporter permease [Fusobacteriaceae bacterium]